MSYSFSSLRHRGVISESKDQNTNLITDWRPRGHECFNNISFFRCRLRQNISVVMYVCCPLFKSAPTFFFVSERSLALIVEFKGQGAGVSLRSPWDQTSIIVLGCVRVSPVVMVSSGSCSSSKMADPPQCSAGPEASRSLLRQELDLSRPEQQHKAGSFENLRTLTDMCKSCPASQSLSLALWLAQRQRTKKKRKK